MTKRHTLFVAIGVLALVAVCTGAILFLQRQPVAPGITRENSESIGVGKSAEAVEAILGSPPQAVFNKRKQIPDLPGMPGDFAYCAVWSGAEADVWVFFDASRRTIKSIWVTSDKSG
jgi:hypothetical protein